MTTFGQWGQDDWGQSPWGGQRGGALAPTILPLNPVADAIGVGQSQPLSIRISDDAGIVIGSISVIVNGVNFVLGGVAVNGASVQMTPNAENGVDLVITPPSPYPFDADTHVLVVVTDTDGNVASLSYSFRVGVGLRLLNAQNPFDNVILAYFNRQLLIDAGTLIPTHWVVTPLTASSRPLTITGVSTRTGQSNVIRLTYTGGGGTYQLRAVGVRALDGSGIETGYDTAIFEVTFGDEDVPTVRLFNSIWGPLGISQRARQRRTMDDHVANRSLALALDEQFRIRMQRLDGSAGLDGRPGKKRT